MELQMQELTSEKVKLIFIDAIGGKWVQANWQGMGLKDLFIEPKKVKVQNRIMYRGKAEYTHFDAWLVMQEHPLNKNGYKIIYEPYTGEFGLVVTESLENEMYILLDSGDFWSVFKQM